MTAGVSLWWPTPADPRDHFPASALERSAAVHGPLRTAGAVAAAAKLVLLVGAAALASTWADPEAVQAARAGERSLLSTITAAPLLLGAAAVVVAIRLPATVADAWFEYRSPLAASARSDDDDGSAAPVPARALAATAAALALVWWLALVVGAGVVYHLAARTGWWPVVLAGGLVAATLAYGGFERSVRTRLPGGERPIDPDGERPELTGRLEALAERFGLAGIEFTAAARLAGPLPAGGPAPGSPASGGPSPSDPASGGPASGGPAPGGGTASAVGFGRHRRIVLSDDLIDGDRSIMDFVVAHELTHIAERHLVTNAAAVLSGHGALIAALAGAMAWDAPFSWFGVDPLDPAGLPVAVVIVVVTGLAVGAVVGWYARYHERVADAGAITVVGPLRRDKAIALQTSIDADLTPGTLERLLASHPAPAERLEFFARYRRASESAPLVP